LAIFGSVSSGVSKSRPSYQQPINRHRRTKSTRPNWGNL
jgi:hypothetical protein